MLKCQTKNQSNTPIKVPLSCLWVASELPLSCLWVASELPLRCLWVAFEDPANKQPDKHTINRSIQTTEKQNEKTRNKKPYIKNYATPDRPPPAAANVRYQDRWKWFLQASRSSLNPPGPPGKANNLSFWTRLFTVKILNMLNFPYNFLFRDRLGITFF